MTSSKYNRRNQENQSSNILQHPEQPHPDPTPLDRQSSTRSRSRRRKQYTQKSSDIFNRDQNLKTDAESEALVYELRQTLKIGKFTTLDLLEFLKAAGMTLCHKGSLNGNDLANLLKDREIFWDGSKCDLLANKFLRSKGDGFVLFSQYLGGRKNSHRGTMMTKLWGRLDLYNHGHTQYVKFLSAFKSDRHPEAISRRVSSEELNLEFKETLETFEEIKGMVVGHGDGVVRQLNGRSISRMQMSQPEFEVFFWMYCFEEDDAYKFEKLFKSVFSMA